eukprot:TRINITY_DN7351_c0_g1_i5.p1 TRINITY_DN7351_c0_g1~~TRINITY_DN7351_c0_g1_i5.p1  ORF type:complete len:140 (-),score=44.63 TRINITY_DN7351_c0_g1_i5:35-454(-)
MFYLCCFLFVFFFLMIRRPPRSTLSSSSAASDVYKRQGDDVDGANSSSGSEILDTLNDELGMGHTHHHHARLQKLASTPSGGGGIRSVSYTHLRAHETPEHLVCRLLLEKKKKNKTNTNTDHHHSTKRITNRTRKDHVL